jgi:pimeloyl-ACP methyl ester carboxylesterase
MLAFFRTLRCMLRWIPLRQHGIVRQLNMIGCPALVLNSENDVRYRAETAMRMAKMMPTAKFVLVEKVTRALNPPDPQTPKPSTRILKPQIEDDADKQDCP